MWHPTRQSTIFGPSVLIASGLVACFVAFGGLSWGWAVIGFLAIAAALAQGSFASVPPRDVVSDAGPSYGPELHDVAHIWREVVAAVPDAAFVLDANDTIIALNSAAAAVFPFADGRHIAQVNRSPSMKAAIERARALGVRQSFEFQDTVPIERHLDGSASPVQISPDGGNHPKAIVVIVLHDRTEAGRLAQMRADFVANASHELRTPLASLKGFIETLQGAARDDEAARAKFLPIMALQAERMARLIDDLLSLSRVEMREHVAPNDRIDLGELVLSAAGLLQAQAKAASIDLTIEHPPTPAVVIGDRDELMQIAQNLVQNAIKYGRHGGHVKVTIMQDGANFTLTVADNGIGIAPIHLPRLTERFYRVSATDSRARGGTGLGLAIVKHIVNRHGGTLEITSTVGEGSKFKVRLPRAAAL
jgi:two-component system, OmpR family, phosphate regulon sensor histidine kinase PhoR